MLYKFFSVNNNSLSALSDSSLWFSKILDFNDPFEGQIKIINGGVTRTETIKIIEGIHAGLVLGNLFTEKELELYLIEIAKKISDGAEDEFKNYIIEMSKGAFHEVSDRYHKGGVCCFSSDINENGDYNEPLKNKLMWGHYADGLRGFSLKFNDDIFLDLNKNSMNESISGPYEIKYVNDYPCIDLIELSKMTFLEKNLKLAEDYINKLITSKNEDWKYENEYRYLSSAGGKLFKFNPNSIELICIGNKMKEENKKRVISIANRLGVKEILEAKLDSESYSIKLHQYNEK